MAEYDGSIRIGTEIDTKGFKDGEKEIESESRRTAESVSKTVEKDVKQIEKELENLKDAQKSFLEAGGSKQSTVYQEYEKEINKLQESLQSLKNTQDDTKISDEHWNQLRIDVEEYAKALKELHDRGKFLGDEDYDKVYLAWKNATDAVKAYQAELNKQTESGKAKAAEQAAKAAEKQEAAQRRTEEQAEKALQKENARIQKQIENEAKEEAKRAKELAAAQAQAEEEQRLADIKANATVSDQQILDLLERRKQLTAEIADMEKAGVGIGYQEYEDAVRELSQINEVIKAYKKSLSELPRKFSDMVNSAKKAFDAASGTSSGLDKEGESAKKAAEKMNVLEKSKKAVTRANKNLGNESEKNLGNESESTANEISKEGEKANLLQSILASTKGSIQKIKTSAKKAFNAISGGSTKSNNSLNASLKTILKYAFGIRSLCALFNKISSAFKEGFTNLVQYSQPLNQSISALMSSLTQLKNSLATAFAPIVQTAIPYITALISYIIQAMNYVTQFVAVLGGKSTWTRAVEVQEDYAASLDNTAASAKKAAGALASFDTLEVLSKKDAGGGGGAGGAISPEDMFEEVPVIQAFENITDNLKKLFDPLLEAWKSKGAFVMDAWKYALDEIRKLLKDIGRDFLRVWNQSETVAMLEDMLAIIGDIGLIVGNLAKNLRIAWDYSDTGFRILEDIRDIFKGIIHNILFAADATVEWSEMLDFRPLFTAIERHLRSLIPIADTLSGILLDFYTMVLLPLGKWVLEKGLPDLLDVMTDLNNSINWDKIRESFKVLNKYLLEISKFTFKALIGFIKDFLSPLAKWTMNRALPVLVDTLTDLFAKIDWDFLNNALITLWSGLSKFTIGIGDGLLNFFQGMEPFLTSAIAGSINTIAAAIAFIGTVFSDIPSAAIEAAAAAIAGILGTVMTYQAAVGVIDAIKTAWIGLYVAIDDGMKLIMAHPYVAIAAGIAGLASALISLNQAAQEQEQIEIFGGKLDDITQKINNTSEALKSRAEASKEYVENAGLAEMGMAQDLADRYFNLAEKESLTNEEKMEMEALAKKLVDTLPGLENYYNTETGLLDTTRQSVQDLIDAKLQEIQLNAAEDKLTEAYKNRIDAVDNLKNAMEPAQAAQEHMNELERQYQELSDKADLLSQYDRLSQQIQAADGDTGELLARQQELWDEITNGGTEDFPSYDSLLHKMGEVNQAIYDFQDEYEQALGALAGADKARQAVETNISDLTAMLTEGMVQAANDSAAGYADALSSNKSMADAAVQQAEDLLSQYNERLGIHSPSTEFKESARNSIEGFVLGIEDNKQSAIDAMTALTTSLLEIFSGQNLAQFGQGMIESIVSVIEEFREIWTESFDEWVECNQELYFGYDIWYEQWSNILLAYMDVNAQFMSEWQASMNTWWNTMVTPFFTIMQWQTFGTNMKTGIINGFKVIVNEIGGVLNRIISMFNAAFEELEEAMNDLIEDYNKAAKTMGTSTLSKVSYSPMANVKVPALADGAVIRGGDPFLAILGDQRRGQTNIEAPLDTIEQAVENVFNKRGYGPAGTSLMNVTIPMYINGTKVAQAVADDLLSELNRQGYDVDLLGWN